MDVTDKGNWILKHLVKVAFLIKILDDRNKINFTLPFAHSAPNVPLIPISSNDPITFCFIKSPYIKYFLLGGV